MRVGKIRRGNLLWRKGLKVNGLRKKTGFGTPLASRRRCLPRKSVPVGVAHSFFGGSPSLSLARRPGLQRDSSLATALSASFMRQRIFLGFVSILIPFMGIGVYSFWLFSRVGGALEAMADDSQRWVLAAKAMKQSVQGMDLTLSSALAGEEEQGRKWFVSYAPVFEGFLWHTAAGA